MATMLHWEDNLPIACRTSIRKTGQHHESSKSVYVSKSFFVMCFVPTDKMHAKTLNIIELYNIPSFTQKLYDLNKLDRKKPHGWWKQTPTMIATPLTIPVHQFIIQIDKLLQGITPELTPGEECASTWNGKNGIPF